MAAVDSSARREIRSACSTDKGADRVKGTDDDVYLDPIAAGYGAACIEVDGQCGAITASTMSTAGDDNDLIDCATCGVASATRRYTRMHSPTN